MAQLGNTVITGALRVIGDEMLSGRLITTKAINDIITGTGTTAQDKGSGVSPRYFPAKWTFNTGQTVTNGDIIVIKIPCAGHDYGVFISIDNGTTYKPAGVNMTGNSRLTTHFGSGGYVAFIYDSSGQINSVYPVAGGDAKVNVSGGCWRVFNFYDTGNTYDRNRYNCSILAWGTKIIAANIIVAANDGKYHHLKEGTAFDIRWPILYLNGDCNANATTTNTYDIIHFTITTTQSISLTAYKPVFIKGTLSGTTFTPVSTAPLTQTVPSAWDGYAYILLGMATAATTLYLQERHPIYKFYSGGFREWNDFEGSNIIASGNYSHAEGGSTTASGEASHAEGNNTGALSTSTHAEGNDTRATGAYGSHAEGYRTTASGIYGSHAEGFNTIATGMYGSHAEGNKTTASDSNSHAEGASTIASAASSHAEGSFTTASNVNSHASGHYNAVMTTGGKSTNTTGTAFVIGNGTASTSLSNAFSVQFNGTVKAASTITASTTADYAEYFEWADENPNNEDRVGYFIAFDSDNKIKIGSNLDEYILGISSGEPFVLGNGDCDVWNGMVLRDEFRRVIYEPAPKLDEEGKPMYDDQGNPLYQGTRPKLNPRYDPTIPYINRADRPEWQAVGMLGVLAVRDNGACQINSYCTVASDGTAKPYTNGDIHKYRVIHRNSQNVIEIVFR